MKAAMERVWQSLVGEEDDGEDNREEEVVVQLQEGRQEGRQEKEDANLALTPPASQAQYKVPSTIYWVQTCSMLLLLLCVFTMILSGNREFRAPCGRRGSQQ
jgi:hypothetical protein